MKNGVVPESCANRAAGLCRPDGPILRSYGFHANAYWRTHSKFRPNRPMGVIDSSLRHPVSAPLSIGRQEHALW